MSKEYKNGELCAKLSKSIHYNPFREKGTVEQYIDWLNGYNSYTK